MKLIREIDQIKSSRILDTYINTERKVQEKKVTAKTFKTNISNKKVKKRRYFVIKLMNFATCLICCTFLSVPHNSSGLTKFNFLATVWI